MRLAAAGEVAEILHHFDLNQINSNALPQETGFGILIVVRKLFSEQRISIFAAYLEFQIPGEMIDTGSPIGTVFKRGTGIFGKSGSAAVSIGAQTDALDMAVIIDRPANHCHGVRIVDQQCIRTQFFHVVADIQYRRYLA